MLTKVLKRPQCRGCGSGHQERHRLIKIRLPSPQSRVTAALLPGMETNQQVDPPPKQAMRLTLRLTNTAAEHATQRALTRTHLLPSGDALYPPRFSQRRGNDLGRDERQASSEPVLRAAAQRAYTVTDAPTKAYSPEIVRREAE